MGEVRRFTVAGLEEVRRPCRCWFPRLLGLTDRAQSQVAPPSKGADQWSAPTPCPDWAVRQAVNHLIGMNRVFAALLAHGWDLAQATGQPAGLPDDLAEQSLAFVRTQLTEQARPGRFGPAQIATEQASAIERLVAFLGRPLGQRTVD